MIPSTLFALVAAALSSFVAVNGAVIERDGTFTYVTPQPTTTTSVTTATTTTTSSRPSTTTASTTSTSQSSVVSLPPPSTTSTNSVPTTSVSATSPTTTSPTTTSPTTTLPTTTYSTTTSMTSLSRPTTLSNTGTTTSASIIPPITTSRTTTPASIIPPTTTPTVTTSATIIPPTVCPPVTTSAPAPGAANCNGIQQWQASFAYTAGDQVIYNGQLFTARQWTYDNAPSAHPDQWTAGGTCAQPINNQANCNGVAAWQQNVAYTTGNRVTFNGHLWSAVQWTESNTPGDTSGSWKDLGACA